MQGEVRGRSDHSWIVKKEPQTVVFQKKWEVNWMLRDYLLSLFDNLETEA